MSTLSVNNIRQKYLAFFGKQDHAVIPSASLLPENDPTTLFTGSGMQPMVPYLLGEKHPQGVRITDSQKCFRSQDIEEVGDNRHTTFFEMLGNWSLGDYFKAEQIPWMYQFVTKELGLDPAHLYVTVFRGNDDVPRDEDSVQIWQETFAQDGIDAPAVDMAEVDGMQGGKIFYYDEYKNWWSRSGPPDTMPIGEPGGPDSEMFWDFGEDLGLHEKSEWKDQPCHVNCDCGRFLEIGNNVFMEYKKTEEGFEKLSQQNVDFGGGLERLAAACNGNPDVFLIDVFDGMRSVIEEACGKQYSSESDDAYAFRVIMDHLRAATFLTSDNAPPGNKDQGYFTRRLVRRAVRFASKIGIDRNFCADVSKAVIETYEEAYPELTEKDEHTLSLLDAEEEQFRKTLSKGEKELQEYLGKNDTIDGAKVFSFYETYGFPRELTEELLEEKGVSITSPEGFEEAAKAHSNLSRTAAAGKFSGGLADDSDETVKLHTATHLLNAALRQVLGDHVFQKGSNITPERLRFDFSHEAKMTDEEKAEVERLVNEAIEADLPIAYHMTTPEGAQDEGAIGVFGERYGAEVKVYTVGDGSFSKEICGGPHVARTGMIGSFTIKKEESSSSGVRRIKAIVSGGPEKVEIAGESE